MRRPSLLRSGVEVEVETEIARPREEVWEFVADPARLAAWLEEFEAGGWVGDPARLGAVVRYTLAGGRSSTYEIVAWEPGRRLAWDGPALGWLPGGSTKPRGSFEFSDAPAGGTHFVARYEPELIGTLVFLRPYLRRWLDRTRKNDMARLKRLLEAGH